MAYFDFLAKLQEGSPPLGVGKGRRLVVPEEPYTREPEGPPAVAFPEVPVEALSTKELPGRTTDEEFDFQKKRARAKDFALAQALDAVENLEPYLAGLGPGGEADSLRARLRAAKPGSYAEIVSQAVGRLTRAGAEIDREGILRHVSDATELYKRLEAHPEAARIARRLEGQDAAARAASIERLRKHREALEERIPFAATQEDQARLLEEHGRAKAKEARLQGLEAGGEPLADLKGIARGNGIDGEEFTRRLQEMRDLLSKGGWDPDAKLGEGAAVTTLANLLASMGPLGIDLLREIDRSTPSGDRDEESARLPLGNAAGVPREADERLQGEIALRERRHEEVYRQLGRLRDFQTTGDVLVFILMSLIMGPRMAAGLFTRKSERGELRGELDMIDRELRSLYARQDQAQRLHELARHHAAVERAQEVEGERRRMRDAEYFKLRSEGQRLHDPAYDALLRGYRLWRDKLDEWQKAHPFEPNADVEQKVEAVRQKLLERLDRAGAGFELEAVPKR